jgi:hypothetical protein
MDKPCDPCTVCKYRCRKALFGDASQSRLGNGLASIRSLHRAWFAKQTMRSSKSCDKPGVQARICLPLRWAAGTLRNGGRCQGVSRHYSRVIAEGATLPTYRPKVSNKAYIIVHWGKSFLLEDFQQIVAILNR